MKSFLDFLQLKGGKSDAGAEWTLSEKTKDQLLKEEREKKRRAYLALSSEDKWQYYCIQLSKLPSDEYSRLAILHSFFVAIGTIVLTGMVGSVIFFASGAFSVVELALFIVSCSLIVFCLALSSYLDKNIFYLGVRRLEDYLFIAGIASYLTLGSVFVVSASLANLRYSLVFMVEAGLWGVVIFLLWLSIGFILALPFPRTEIARYWQSFFKGMDFAFLPYIDAEDYKK